MFAPSTMPTAELDPTAFDTFVVSKEGWLRRHSHRDENSTALYTLPARPLAKCHAMPAMPCPLTSDYL